MDYHSDQAFRFRCVNLNNSRSFKFASEKFANVAHNLAKTFVSNPHTCHCLAVVAAKSVRNRFIRHQNKACGEHGHMGMVIDEANTSLSPTVARNLLSQQTQARIQQLSTRTKSLVNGNLRNTKRTATSTRRTSGSKTTFAE